MTSRIYRRCFDGTLSIPPVLRAWTALTRVSLTVMIGFAEFIFGGIENFIPMHSEYTIKTSVGFIACSHAVHNLVFVRSFYSLGFVSMLSRNRHRTSYPLWIPWIPSSIADSQMRNFMALVCCTVMNPALFQLIEHPAQEGTRVHHRRGSFFEGGGQFVRVAMTVIMWSHHWKGLKLLACRFCPSSLVRTLCRKIT